MIMISLNLQSVQCFLTGFLVTRYKGYELIMCELFQCTSNFSLPSTTCCFKLKKNIQTDLHTTRQTCLHLTTCCCKCSSVCLASVRLLFFNSTMNEARPSLHVGTHCQYLCRKVCFHFTRCLAEQLFHIRPHIVSNLWSLLCPDVLIALAYVKMGSVTAHYHFR